MVNVMQLNNRKDKRLKVMGDYIHFQVWGSESDYVEETVELMQQMARHCFVFPFYVHVETFGDHDSIREMLDFQKHVKLTFRSSDNKIWTTYNGRPVQEELLSFSLQVKDLADLKLVFDECFHLAQQNFSWVMTQGTDVCYADGTLVIDMWENAVALIAEHDGYGFSMLTNTECFKDKAQIMALYGT